jgi:hypothetical protein
MQNRNKIITTILLALGSFALPQRIQAVGPDTDGNIPGSNNGEGIGVLVSRTGGVWNTGTGFEALNHLTGGNQNTATGLRALNSDTNGGFNTATGVLSLFSNINGFFNSATGAYSLANNTTGSDNVANGYSALYYNIDGHDNTATGFGALYHNTTGLSNTANGVQALYSNTSGSGNTAIGLFALKNITGDYDSNIALGANAGVNLFAGENNIYIGSVGVDTESNTIHIGYAQTKTLIAGISGVDEGGTPSAVYINGNGRLGTQPPASSRRFKKEIRPMDRASEGILRLKPVTFHYKSDASSAPQFGLIAEEVAEVNPDLVVRDENGEIYTVRYDAVNAMLLNEFLKEHRKVEQQDRKMRGQDHKIQQQETTIAQLKKEMETVVARLEKQGVQIQKVSAQLEVSKPAPQTVSNK